MHPDAADNTRTAAITHLEGFGLSAYAARTFVALVLLGEGTARDVSEAADVPRTRVYDAADELRARGLVEIRESTPRRFRPVSSETARQLFDREYARRVRALVAALDAMTSG